MKPPKTKLMLAAAAATLLCLGTRAEFSLDDGLVAYYKFDGDIADSSGNGYDWTGTAATWTTDRGGEDNRAALFSGSGTLTPNDLFGEVVISNSLTIAVWVKPSGTLPTNLGQTGFGTGGSKLPTSGTEILFPSHGGYSGYAGVGLFVGTNGIAVVRHRDSYIPVTLLWYNAVGENWIHVAITISDNSGPVLYVNGVHVATGVQIGSGSINFIGKSFYYPDSYSTYIGPFRGTLDEMRFYDRALGAEEIAKFMGTKTITWLNDDSSEIDTTEVADGFTPTHAEPTKSATTPYRYLFSGWTPELEPVVSNTTYTATFQKIADTSLLTEDWQAANGDAIVVTNATAHSVTIPAGASVTINGVTIKGASGGGGVTPAPTFAADGKAATTEFVQGEGGKWTLTTFAELSNDAVGADVAAEQIKVYAADTVEGLESASPMTSGVTVTEKKSAVKTIIEVTPPPAAPAQFFKVKFGE